MIKQIIGAVIAPITEVIRIKQERKVQRDVARAKLAQAKQAGETEVTLKDAELEVVLANQMEKSWKDEFVTIVILLPYILIFIGGVSAAFGEPRVLEGVSLSIQTLVAADVDVGTLMTAVVFSAIGLSFRRAR
jgi:hypothetical protein